MAKKLRIVIVSFVDDNFGDNLIRTSFQALLEVALTNHGLSSDDYEVARMPLKGVDPELLENADVVFFAGGGLFGLSYLGFYPHVDQITAIADRRGIPVVFSSMGMNNMGAEAGQVDSIAEIIARDSVKSLSVRENLAVFQQAAARTSLNVRHVADPAVWTKYVYGMPEVAPDRTLGINVVRGGLFAANDRPWGLTAEMDYLEGLRKLAGEAGVVSQLYTNGSLDDNNTLRYFQKQQALPNRDVVLPQTTREVIEAIASRSMIASIRMHSSIIAYSFGVPTVGLQWNDKLPHFYDAIGHPERLLPFGEWTAENAFKVLQHAGTAPQADPQYRAYLMSTYEFIHESVGTHVLGQPQGVAEVFTFEQVASALLRRASLIDEAEFDLRVKLNKAERAYLQRFITIRANEAEIRGLHKAKEANAALAHQAQARIADLEAEVDAGNRLITQLRQNINGLELSVESRSREADDLRRTVTELEQEVESLSRTVRVQKQELDRRIRARLARYIDALRRKERPGSTPSN